jgi:hypothetical protein
MKMKNLLWASALFFSLSACENLAIDSEDGCDGELKSISATSSQKDDQALLGQLNADLVTMAKATTCTAGDKYAVASLGQKPCGGPAGFIAYSTSINTECFLKKVDHYNTQSAEYNKKHSPISDCMLLQEPTSAVCEGGKIVFKY